jgi:predicted transcriptional regulator
MDIKTKKDTLSQLEKSIIKALLYYDVFNHPLTINEISASCKCKGQQVAINVALENLLENGLVFKDQGFYFLYQKTELVNERLSEKKKLERYLKKAGSMTNLIAHFPFVRGVMLSGSLSKFRIYDDGDIDYLIVTKPGRLWIARTLLVLYKKIFLFNSYRYLCLNFFIDENSLHFDDKTRYSATEVATLIPTYNYEIYKKLIKANKWIESYFPNFKKRKKEHVVSNKRRWLKQTLEFLLNNKVGDGLDSFFMKQTLRYRKKKFGHISEERFRQSFTTKKNISTHHPGDYQFSAVEKYHLKIKEYENKYKLNLG